MRMSFINFHRLALAIFAAPLALGLAACGGGNGGSQQLSGEPLANVPPPQGKSWTDVVQKTKDGGYLQGNPKAPIKLVEFGALSCSHCAEFSKESANELENKFIDNGRVSWELRLFMLNALDVPAALLVTCGAPEAVPALSHQFWAWQPNMFENLQKAGEAKLQAISSEPPQTRFISVAKLTGMDQFITSRGIAADQAQACLADQKKAADLANQTQAATTTYDVQGTPTFLINGQKVDINTWSEIKARLEKMGAR
jgi:protein-disulfide isomerase